jgi:hypothetical protein
MMILLFNLQKFEISQFPQDQNEQITTNTVAAKSNANALFSLQRHEQERSQPAQLSV